MEKLVDTFKRSSLLDKFDYACLAIVVACGLSLATVGILKTEELSTHTLENSNIHLNLKMDH